MAHWLEHLVACDRVSKPPCSTSRPKVQRLAAPCPTAWTDVWLSSLPTDLLVGRRGIEWSRWRGGCGHSQGDYPLSLSISGCNDVSCTRSPRTRHMGESVTLTSPSCISMQQCRCPVPTQEGPCHCPDSPPGPPPTLGADRSIRVQCALSLVLAPAFPREHQIRALFTSLHSQLFHIFHF